MDHLQKYFGEVINMKIPYLIQHRETNCCVPGHVLQRRAPFGHGSQYHDFINFPSSHGWKVQPENYRLVMDTHDKDQTGPNTSIEGTDEFAQAWLFFCLLNVVVRTDKPLLHMCELVYEEQLGPGNVRINVCTEHLEDRITEWHKWMKKNPSQAKFRLMQTDLVLEFARQVVRANFDEEPGEVFKLEYPQISLSIMVLGETLSAVKASILREMGERILGWEGDDLNGWGYPLSVTKQMSVFCEYTKNALIRQIGPNATLLLAALKHHTWHEGATYGCNETECKYIKASPPTSSVNSTTGTADFIANVAHDNYLPKCECKTLGKTPCKLVGPNMEDVYEILRKGSASFPVFEVNETEDKAMKVTVQDWSQVQRDSAFATVSHVWSQGLGNPNSNEIQYVHFPLPSK